jgi:hypothetical protein
MDRVSRRFGVRVDLLSNGTLGLRWAGARATGSDGCTR